MSSPPPPLSGAMSMLRLLSVCQLRTTALLMMLAATLSEARGRGRRSRARSRRGRRRPRSKPGQKDEDDQESWWTGGWFDTPSKAEAAHKQCGHRAPLPPERMDGAFAPENKALPGEAWRYLQLPGIAQQLDNGHVLEQVDWTQTREALCRSLFAAGEPPATMAVAGQSTLVCVLSSNLEDANEQALFASDYNTARGLPNYVAFVLPGRLNSTALPASTWFAPAADEFDASYASGVPEACCWCVDEGSNYECGEAVGARGHLAPVAAFSPAHAKAADVFLNTVPMRKPFIEKQWARQLQELFGQGDFFSAKIGRRLHVMMGPSLQSDGRLPATASSSTEGIRTSLDRTVEVPSFVWAAYADTSAVAASGHFCRNGGVDDDCACVDGLAVRDLEQRLGLHLFPGVQTPAELPSFNTLAPNSSTSYLLVGGGILAALSVVICCVVACGGSDLERSRSKSKTERDRNKERSKQREINLRANRESAVVEKNMRAQLESRAGGAEALRARFRAV